MHVLSPEWSSHVDGLKYMCHHILYNTDGLRSPDPTSIPPEVSATILWGQNTSGSHMVLGYPLHHTVGDEAHTCVYMDVFHRSVRIGSDVANITEGAPGK